MNRASAGNWVENRTLVRHAPDAVVLINGYAEFATCPSCNRTINLQKYITTISADPSVEMSSTANFSLSIPQWDLSRFMRDGVPILQPSLEVVVFMRGYFPMKDFANLGQNTQGFDASQVPLYPYYQVFRGVVTNVTHGYSGGFYTASVQCSNFLHFWTTQYISTNGAVMGSRPKGSMVEPSLVGSTLTGMNPYEIIYTLVKATFGAAYGVEFKFSEYSNVDAEDDAANRNLFTHAAEWWAKNFSKNQGNLRMYGADGSMFNAAQQTFLGAWGTIKIGRFEKLTAKVYTALKKQGVLNPLSQLDVLKTLRENLYNKVSTTQAIAANEGGSSRVSIDTLKMQAFVLDIGKMGQVNLFESEYMTKSQIAEQILTITGYEFYQDVDGDLVFKPPAYNMDTSSDPVYVIEDRDLISIDETETEPEATMVKATGSHFANLAGHGVDGWMGVGAVFIDYRLVAKFGYKEDTFECNYLSSRHALYISCVNRLDLANVGVKSASISIPLRPEMRPGYPVYIRAMDCFYYVKSISHSFAFNGQCTSTLTCVAKRAKWFPPMAATSGGGLPSIEDVRLDAPGEYPQRPLMAYPQYLDPSNSEGPPQTVGFPNVVLALDATKVNFDSVDIPRNILTPEAYIEIALSKGILQRGPTPEEFVLSVGNFRGQTVTLSEIQDSYASVDAALAAGEITPDLDTAFGKILSEVEKIYNTVDSPEIKQLVNYLALQTSLKNYYSPGTSILGRYRYYSSSHPDAEHQAPENLLLDVDPPSAGKETPPPPDSGGSTPTLQDVGGGRGVQVTDRNPIRGIKIANLSNLAEETNITVTVATSDIRFVTSGPQYQNKFESVSEVKEAWNEGENFRFAEKQTIKAFTRLLDQCASTEEATKTLRERFSAEYDRLVGEIDTFASKCGVAGDAPVSQKKTLCERETRKSDYAKTASQAAPRQEDASAVEAQAGVLAGVLWKYLSSVADLTIRKLKLRESGNTVTTSSAISENYRRVMGYRAEFIRAYTKGDLIVPDAAPARIYDKASLEKTKRVSWTPIFPVSDGAGYEVFGNLPYGRGITIQKYADLLQSTREVPGGVEDGAQRAAEGKTNLGNYSVNGSNAEALEQLLVAYTAANPKGAKKNLSAAQLLQQSSLFSDSDQAGLLATLNTDITGVDAVVESLLKGEVPEEAFVRNRPVTSFMRGQSFTSEVAAQNLAQLTYGETSCSCQGSDAMFLVAALSEEFVGDYGNDPLVPWMQEQVYLPQTGIGEYTKRVLAGEYLDTRNSSLAEEFASQGSLGNIYGNQVQDLTSQVSGLTSSLPDEEI